MARIVTVVDDELGTSARIEIGRTTAGGHAIRRIVLEAADDAGLPDQILNALIPYIGLPAVSPSERIGPPPRPKAAAAPPRRPALESAPGRKRRKYRPAPSDAELAAAIEQLGDRPRDLAGHYGVPNSIVSNWLYAWRKRANQ